jgi:hypothetical protein
MSGAVTPLPRTPSLVFTGRILPARGKRTRPKASILTGHSRLSTKLRRIMRGKMPIHNQCAGWSESDVLDWHLEGILVKVWSEFWSI